MANQENKVVRTDAYYGALSLLTDAVRKRLAAIKTEKKAADIAYESGIRWQHTYSPKQPEAVVTIAGTEITREQLYSDLREAVIMAMPASVRKLILAPKAETKNWTPEAKAERRKANESVGGYMGSLREQLYLREHGISLAEAKKKEKEEKEKNKKGPDDTTPKTPKEKILVRLSDVIKYAQEDESPDYDVTKLVKAIEAIKKSL